MAAVEKRPHPHSTLINFYLTRTICEQTEQHRHSWGRGRRREEKEGFVYG